MKWLRFFSVMLFLPATLLGVSRASGAEALVISLAQTPLSLPFFVAESEGYFAGEGVPIKINNVAGGHRTLQQLLNGEADLATSSDAVIMFNSFQRSDFAVIATFVTSNDDVKVIIRKDVGIARPEQMAGKRIATVVGAASHYYLDTWLLLHGVDPKSTRIINLQPEDMESALAKGEVDAVAIWEPIPFKILKAVAGATILPNPGIYILSFNLIAHKKLLGVRDDDLVKLLRALDRAQRFIKADPLKAQAILRTRLQLDQAFIAWIWPRYNFRLTLDQSLLSTLEGEARWARNGGYVAGNRSPNYLDFIYPGPLHKVRPEAVGIAR